MSLPPFPAPFAIYQDAPFGLDGLILWAEMMCLLANPAQENAQKSRVYIEQGILTYSSIHPGNILHTSGR